MSEPRKNHLSIDGGQVKEDEHVASYKPIPDSDAVEFRSSKGSLHKSKERVDEAEEKLLEKEDEAKITTRVDMADAKYVVGDHRNGDAKIELDANKRQFTGLTKEELMQYADDPFWVRLRWTMFALFWALWLCMLAGAVAIIVQAPKCAPPPPKTWYEKGPLVEAEEFADMGAALQQMRAGGAEGWFAPAPCGEDAYHVLETPECVERFKTLVSRAKEHGIKVIVDLVANFVPTSHEWFRLSENRSAGYGEFFVWANGQGFDAANNPVPPNNWVATTNEPAWSYSAVRKQHYLHQLGSDKADLNFFNAAVVEKFQQVLTTYVKAGASGVRLHNARTLLVNMSFPDEKPAGERSGLSAAHAEYAFWRHQHAADQPALDALLGRWGAAVAQAADGDSVFTITESGAHTELYLLARNVSSLRPPSAAPVDASAAPAAVASDINKRLKRWPLLQLKSEGAGAELAAFALLLPAAPVLALDQLEDAANTTASESLSRILSLRSDATIEHGNWSVRAVPALNSSEQLLAVARWKVGHTGYVAVWNGGASTLQADLTPLPALPAALTVHRVSPAVRELTGYSSNQGVSANNVTVPAASSVVLSFVPESDAGK